MLTRATSAGALLCALALSTVAAHAHPQQEKWAKQRSVRKMPAAELVWASDRLNRVMTAKENVRRNDARPRLSEQVGTPAAGATIPSATERMREIVREIAQREYVLSMALHEIQPDQPRELLPDLVRELTSPFRSFRDMVERYVESTLRPSGNCQAFATVDRRTRQVVADIARELNGTAYAFSCFRSVAHNRRVGGARRSQHIARKALDFRIVGRDGKVIAPRRVAVAARRHPLMKHAGGIGTYCGNTVHVDSGPRRTWHWGCGKKRTRLAYRKQHRG